LESYRGALYDGTITFPIQPGISGEKMHFLNFSQKTSDIGRKKLILHAGIPGMLQNFQNFCLHCLLPYQSSNIFTLG
jgi:hypothetical protein